MSEYPPTHKSNDYYAYMKMYFGKLLNFTANEQRGYLGGNAMCFLGLVKNKDGSIPKNRERLEKFRKTYRLGMSIFNKIDTWGIRCNADNVSSARRTAIR